MTEFTPVARAGAICICFKPAGGVTTAVLVAPATTGKGSCEVLSSSPSLSEEGLCTAASAVLVDAAAGCLPSLVDRDALLGLPALAHADVSHKGIASAQIDPEAVGLFLVFSHPCNDPCNDPCISALYFSVFRNDLDTDCISLYPEARPLYLPSRVREGCPEATLTSYGGRHRVSTSISDMVLRSGDGMTIFGPKGSNFRPYKLE